MENKIEISSSLLEELKKANNEFSSFKELIKKKSISLIQELEKFNIIADRKYSQEELEYLYSNKSEIESFLEEFLENYSSFLEYKIDSQLHKILSELEELCIYEDFEWDNTKPYWVGKTTGYRQSTMSYERWADE